MPDRPEATPRFDKALRALARPVNIQSQPLPALHAVMSMRHSSEMEQEGRDPLADIALRLHSLGAALEFAALRRCINRMWPVPFDAHHTSSDRLSADEAALSAMMRTAEKGDRAAFGHILNGFVRPERHEALFAACVAFAIALAAA
ncbi:hypothetical protein RXV95_05685 [Novosphingobium sp. ZN18A2]|uniref:hypothetical protein n=1 Tax=Novosphingobium sp. ZN18A2 TaxID=3079861 RepID=UPI0030D56D67